MKIVMNETYDYLYNVWTYEKDHVYNVEDVPRSDFYHYWHGPNLDVIPHALAHPAAANEIKSLPDGDALHKHDKPVKLSMDSVLNPKHVDIPESERPAVIESMDDFDDMDDDDETDMIEHDTAENKNTARATGRKRKNGSSTAQHAKSDDSSSNDSTKTVKTARKTAKASKTADSKTASKAKRKAVKKTSTRKTAKNQEE